MNQTSEAWYIEQCLREIESQLQWGPGEQWSSYDFEKLSELIQDATNVTLSVSTLKRLWGKVTYQHLPALNTLNTIARFAGHADWRQFKQSRDSLSTANENVATTSPDPSVANTASLTAGNPSPVTTAPAVEPPHPTNHKFRKYYWLAALLLVIAAGYVLAGKKNMATPAKNSAIVTAPDPKAFQFRANKMVTAGLPNSVVFTYDASAAQTDSVFIVQTWDITRAKLVPKNNHEHSAIYYYPGFFRTKLIADGAVVKTHDLLVGTEGWLALAEEEPEPLYFKQSEYLRQHEIVIDKATLQSYNLPLHPKPPKIRIYNMQPLDSLMNDNFIFETDFKNDFKEGVGACQRAQVLIQCKDDVIVIPLAARSCIGDISLYACGQQLMSNNADLSGFGTDLSQWTNLKVTCVNKLITFMVNGKKAASFTFPNEPTGIVGVQFRFLGTGNVKNTRFLANNKVYAL